MIRTNGSSCEVEKAALLSLQNRNLDSQQSDREQVKL